jgi:hypothetical protein
MRGHHEVRPLREIALLWAVVSTSGCYQYRNVPLTEPPPVGREVRIHLSESGFTRLSATAGEQVPRLSRTIEGDLVQANEGSFLVALRVWSAGAPARDELVQRVSIPARDVSQLELKQLDKRKVGLIAAGAGAVLGVFIVRYVSGVFGGTTGPLPEPGPSEMTVLR